MHLPTIAIQHPSNPSKQAIINVDDYDEKVHVKWREGKNEVEDKPVAKPKPKLDTRFVSDAAEALARKHDLDPADIVGTGKGGRIAIRDVRALL